MKRRRKWDDPYHVVANRECSVIELQSHFQLLVILLFAYAKGAQSLAAVLHWQIARLSYFFQWSIGGQLLSLAASSMADATKG